MVAFAPRFRCLFAFVLGTAGHIAGSEAVTTARRSCDHHLVNVLSERYQQALVDAAQWHHDQFRKETNVPYLSHLLSVSVAVMDDGGDEDECIAGLLHDAVEDTNTSLAMIRSRYGDRVAALVEACTDDDGGNPANKPAWWARKVRHGAHVGSLVTVNPSVARVAAADKLSNLRSTLDDGGVRSGSTFARFKTGLGGFAWYYRTVGATLTAALPEASLLRQRLQRSLVELEDIVEDYRLRYASPLRVVTDQLVALDRPTGSGSHDPWPWFALDVVHRSGGAVPGEELTLRAWAGWFDEPVPRDGVEAGKRLEELRQHPTARTVLHALR